MSLQEADTDHTGEAAQMAQQMLTFYELDLGLNHVVRKYTEPLEDQANLLIAGQKFIILVYILYMVLYIGVLYSAWGQ